MSGAPGGCWLQARNTWMNFLVLLNGSEILKLDPDKILKCLSYKRATQEDLNKK